MATVLTLCGSLDVSSANRAVVEAAAAHLADRATVVRGEIGDLPLFRPGDLHERHPAVIALRRQASESDVAIIGGPEYAGSISGVLKNALDWLVGSGGLYRTPVGVVTAGLSSGGWARQAMARTLAWHGAFVVAQLGIGGVADKVRDGVLVHPDSVRQVAGMADRVLAAASKSEDDLAPIVASTLAELGVDRFATPPGD